MSTDSFTNALLITLITLIGFIGGVGIRKINELIKDVRALLLSDLSHKNAITNLQDDIDDHESRIKKLEKQ